MGERVAEVFEPVRCAHDVGVDDQRHDPRQSPRVAVQLLQLVDRAVEIFRGLMMLDQHHRDVVAFLRVGQVDDRLAAARLQPHRLVVERQVADMIVTRLGEEVGRLPRLGETRAEPATRIFAGRLSDETDAIEFIDLLEEPSK